MLGESFAGLPITDLISKKVKAKFLKKFRRRFTIKYDRSEFFPVALVDHQIKTVERYSSIEYGVCYGASKILGFNAWRKRMDKLERRADWREYYKAYFSTTAN